VAALRTLVIVSQDRSDIFFANQLARHLNVIGIVVENQRSRKPSESRWRKVARYLGQPAQWPGKIRELLDKRFVEPGQLYNRPGMALDFGGEDQRIHRDRGIPVWHTLGVNDINSGANRQWIGSQNPDVIAVCGASLLGPEILALAPRGVLNLHGGLSQYYRGLFTTDWAIHDGVPERIGGTVHFITPGIDDGDVVYQGRPDIEADDTPHSLYEKVVRLGAGMMIQAIRDIENDALSARQLPRRGTLCLNSMFTQAVKRRTWRQIEHGVLRNYLAERERRDAAVVLELINPFTAMSVVNGVASTRRWSG
jgi:hypothetical protein